MHEIALITLLLLPNWGIFSDFRTNLTEYVKPEKKVISLEKSLPIANESPIKLTTDTYNGNEKSIYSIDLDSNTILISNNIEEKLQVASLTKLMTAYVALKDGRDLDEIITVPNFSLNSGDAVVGLSVGDKLTYRDLLAGMLINSGSDAAQAVAIISGGSVSQFVANMNEAADTLELTNTHFTNPVGWDEDENYSSARDIANLSRILLGNTHFQEIVSTKNATISTKSGRTINLSTTNQLLGVNGFKGIKTGYTYGALECLASLEKIDEHQVLTVILGSSDRFGETVAANTWTKQHFLW